MGAKNTQRLIEAAAVEEAIDLGSNGIKADVIAESTAAAGVTVDGLLIKDGSAAAATLAAQATKLAAGGSFRSTEQTGTGSAQNIAHGLGTVPAAVIHGLSEFAADEAVDVAYGTHTTTNVVMTVTNGVKFYVLALK
jgi:hypothetical protein